MINNKQEKKIEEEISIGQEKYICTVQPIVLDENMMVGIFVYLRKIRYTIEKKQDKRSTIKNFKVE